MPVEAVFITSPTIDFAMLLGLTHEALGYNIAGAADGSHRKMADPEKFLSCLAAFKDESAEITSSLLSHVSFGVLVAGRIPPTSSPARSRSPGVAGQGPRRRCTAE